MENTPTNDLQIPSNNAADLTPEPNLPAPHFDEVSIQNARPAVPLAPKKARRFWPLAVILMCGSSLLGGVLGLALSRYENRSAQISNPAAKVAPDGSRVSTESGKDADSTESGSDRVSTESGSDRILRSTANQSEPGSQSLAGGEEKTTDAGRGANSPVGDESMSDTQDGDAHAKLQGALEEWIAATNARDIQRQMEFYNPTVNAFYLTRNVPREAVRSEKSRVFAHADRIDIRAAAPGIRLSRDGRTATMRFRKKYAIEGGGEDRRGEVVQELRWRRTDDGWKIVSERDLRVIH